MMRPTRTLSTWSAGIAALAIAAAACTSADPAASAGPDAGADNGDDAAGAPELGYNRPPAITQLDASPNPVEIGASTTLEAEADDPDGDDLEFRWETPEGWSVAEMAGATVELEAPDRARASASIELEVRDGRGGSDRGVVYIETRADRPPSIETMVASPPQVEAGETSTVEVAASDPDGDELSYNWNAPNGWIVDGSGERVDVTAPDQKGDTGTIAVEVTDGNGNSASARVVVTTVSNRGPRVQSLTADPPRAPRGGTIQLNVNASDPDGDSLSYAWTAGGTNWTINSAGSSATLEGPDAPGASTRVEVDVTDSAGESVRAAVVVSTEPNRPPSLSTVTANPPTVPTGGTSGLDATVRDPEGDSLTYDWSAPSGWNVSGQGAAVALEAPDAHGASALIQMTATDSHGASVNGTVVVETERNDPPSLASVVADPAVVEATGTSNLTAYASDPQGDSLSYSWSGPWTISGGGKTVQVTAPDQFGLSAQFEVTVTDDTGASTTGSVTVDTKRIPNQSPEIASVSASPNPVLETETSTVQVNASDPENDPLTYSWSLSNGNWSRSGTGDSITLTPPAAGSSSVTVTVTVEDSVGNATSSTVTVDSTGWSHYAEVTVDGSGLSSDQTGYPVRIDIPAGSSIYNETQSGGADLRFASSRQNSSPATFDIPYWIENWNPSGESHVWVRVPSVPAGTSSSLYMYVDNAQVSSESAFSSVFQNVYKSSGATTMSGTQTYDWFEVRSGDTITVEQSKMLTIDAQNIVIRGEIDGAGQGYSGGSTSSAGNGPGGGGTSSDAGAGGGGYGGSGGKGGYDSGDSPGSGGTSYGGSTLQSVEMGSGGGGSSDTSGGAGGAALRLEGHNVEVSGTVRLDGVAPSSEGETRNAGGGAGGGFVALATDYLLDGSVGLSGGDGGDRDISANDGGGGGAGGRYKAFYSETRTNNGTIDVSGGSGGLGGDTASGEPGDSGSIHRSQNVVSALVSVGSIQPR